MTNSKDSRSRLYEIRVIRIATSAMAGLLVAIAVTTFWRRHVGAFEIPLPTSLFLTIGVLIICPTVLLRHWWRHATRSCVPKVPMVETVWTLYTPTVSLLTILVTISVPGTSPTGIALVGTLFLFGELTLYRPQKKPAGGLSDKTVEAITQAIMENEERQMLENEEMEPESKQELAPAGKIESQPEDGVSQQLTRCRTEDGRDCLRGWLRVEIPAGLRAQNVHLAFCPAFETSPTIDVQTEGDGPKNRIKTVQCLPYGVHLEVKLTHPSPTDETLTLRFQAVGE
ncbi:MAG: hypothetical protein PVH19_15750 [Planctomycetia bacterium]|jgi:hypothetical protein